MAALLKLQFIIFSLIGIGFLYASGRDDQYAGVKI